MPERIQRRRTKGWRAPASAVYVGRPGRWGNPFTTVDRQEAVSLYRDFLDRNPGLVVNARRELAGKDLLCWCPPDGPCHADVLLEIANPTEVQR